MDAAEVIDGWFAAQPDVTVERLDRDRWFTVLRGEHKRTIPVLLRLGEEHLDVQSFFLAPPDENHAAIYRYLLQRNTRTYLLRFALSPAGDVLLVGLVPRAALDAGLVDRLLGQVLAAADEAFDPALRLGFASYIEREQAWRTRVGAPRNPIT